MSSTKAIRVSTCKSIILKRHRLTKVRAYWPLRKKWLTYATFCTVYVPGLSHLDYQLIECSCLVVGLNATSITASVTEMNHHFNTSDDQFPVSYLPVTSWTLGAALFPLFILPMMEKYGFRWPYLVSLDARSRNFRLLTWLL